jgi:hypothetical protein
MSLQIDPPFSLGQTLGVTSATDGAQWVGVVKLFPDVNPQTGAIRSSRVKKCIAVRNSSGATLYGKRAVAFSDGSYAAISGYKRVTGDQIAGVSDEFLPAAGVVANDVFWVTVEGPSQVEVSQTVAVGDFLVQNVSITTSNATSSAGTGGQGATTSATGAAGSPKGSVIGRVISGTTNASPVVALVDIV